MTLRYKLRTLLIVLALGPPVLAGAWFAAQIEWTDELLLAVAVVCATVYWLGIAALLTRSFRRLRAWGIACAAGAIWPGLVFMSFMQLLVAIPVWTVLLANGGDLSQPISPKTAAAVLGATVAFILWVSAVALMHG